MLLKSPPRLNYCSLTRYLAEIQVSVYEKECAVCVSDEVQNAINAELMPVCKISVMKE